MKHNKDALNGSIEELDYKLRKEFPSIENYIALRRNISAAFPCFDLIEITINVPESIFADEIVNVLTIYASDNISWINDLFSVEKEREYGNVSNYVLVAEKAFEKGLIKDDPDRYVLKHIKREFDQFTELYQKIESDPSKKEMLPYIKGLVYWMSVHVKWYDGYTDRYYMKEHSFNILENYSSDEIVDETLQKTSTQEEYQATIIEK